MDRRQEFRDRYLTHLSTPVDVSPPVAGDLETAVDTTPERAFVLDGLGRTVITAPLREIAAANKGFLYLHGRFVEADTPNRNRAMWTTKDLEVGQATVAGGPLNWLHQETTIVGSLLAAELVRTEKAAAGIGNHITSTAAMWRFLFPDKADHIEKAAADRQLWFSMECVSERVQCAGDDGCGEEFGYGDYMSRRACSHLNERAGVRRFVDPLFLGGALIVPPVRPGWANADVEVARQAAAVTEEQQLAEDNMTRPEAEYLVQRVLEWANRS